MENFNYFNCASYLRTAARDYENFATDVINQRVADQFKRQAAEANAMADAFENGTLQVFSVSAP